MEAGGALEGFEAGGEGGRVVAGDDFEEVGETEVCLADAEVGGEIARCGVHGCCVGVVWGLVRDVCACSRVMSVFDLVRCLSS